MSDFIQGETFVEVYEKLLRNVYESPDHISSPRGSEIREIISPSIRVLKPWHRFLKSAARSTPMRYAAGEFVWYFSGSHDVDFIKKYSAFWNGLKNQYTTPDEMLKQGQVNSSYGYLAMNVNDASWRGKNVSQWEWALETMLRDNDTRQAIVHINRPSHQQDWIRDFPCTLTYQFLLRDRKLHMVATMRSNDLIFGLTFDFPMFSFFQEVFLANLKQLDDSLEDVTIGHLTLTAGSSHIYKKDFDLVERMLGGDDLEDAEPNVPIKWSPVNAERVGEGIDLTTSPALMALLNIAKTETYNDTLSSCPVYDSFANSLILTSNS